MSHLTSPDECRSCRALWQALDRRRAADAGLISTADLGAEVGLGVRATRAHLAVLVTAGRLDIDRRTPLAPVGQRRPAPVDPTPGQWAATRETRDRTCGRILAVVSECSGADWSTALSQAEIARHARVSERTTRTHLHHLIEDEILRREKQPLRTGERWTGRAPDRYVLLSGLLALPARSTVPATDVEALPGGRVGGWFGDVARQLVDALPWYSGPRVEPGDLEAAVREVARHLRGGIPERVLWRMLTRRTIRPGEVHDPYALLLALLPPPGARYVIPAADVHGAAADRAACPSCGVIYRDPTTPPGITCRDCSRAHAPAAF